MIDPRCRMQRAKELIPSREAHLLTARRRAVKRTHERDRIARFASELHAERVRRCATAAHDANKPPAARGCVKCAIAPAPMKSNPSVASAK